MEQVIVSLIMGFVQSIPALIEAVQASTTLTADQKKALLFDLDHKLTEAKVKVAAVRFKELPIDPAKP